MRTRKSVTPKATTAKKTPPPRKPVAKAALTSSDPETTAEPQQLDVEAANDPEDVTPTTPGAKVGLGTRSAGKKITKKAIALPTRKSTRKCQRSNLVEAAKEKIEQVPEMSKLNDENDSVSMNQEDPIAENVEVSPKEEATTVESEQCATSSVNEVKITNFVEPAVEHVDGCTKEEAITMESEECAMFSVNESLKMEHNEVKDVGNSLASNQTIAETQNWEQAPDTSEVHTVETVGDFLNQGKSIVGIGISSNTEERINTTSAEQSEEDPKEEINISDDVIKVETIEGFNKSSNNEEHIIANNGGQSEEDPEEEITDVTKVDAIGFRKYFNNEEHIISKNGHVSEEDPEEEINVSNDKTEVEILPGISKSSNNEEHVMAKSGDKPEEDPEEEINVNNDETKVEASNIEDKREGEDALPEGDNFVGDEPLEDYEDKVDYGDEGEDYAEEPTEETQALEEERRELTAVASKKRTIKKEYEIYVGGLDRDTAEEDLRKVFEIIGEVVEVRLHKNLPNDKNKAYAFVRFANKEHVKRALSEMKNPVIRGKQCDTAPSEDNDTLFLGNICNTWTKEAIQKKLKGYGVEGVEEINLVLDSQHQGKSRGFAFIEFSCHVDAMHAYKRLQKPDAIFGHTERTAKVAFAEPVREPNPEVMSQVKTVFLDGLPPKWDEGCVGEQLKDYGEITKIVLARNMSTAKRRDFGFVDFSTHERAVACIDGINNDVLSDGTTKAKVKARLSNPMPKAQAVKGGMCGGYRIGRPASGVIPRFARGFTRGGFNLDWPKVNCSRGFYPRGRFEHSGLGPNEYGPDNHYGDFRGRQITGRGGQRGYFQGGFHVPSRGGGVAGPSRSNYERPWPTAYDIRSDGYISSRRPPFIHEDSFNKPFHGRRVDDPYYYNNDIPGMKRSFYDLDPDCMDPRSPRPRFDYTGPAVSSRGTHHRHYTGGDGIGQYSHAYYGPDYGAYPYNYSGDWRPRGGGY